MSRADAIRQREPQRKGICDDEDAFEIQHIEVSFAVPVLVTQDQQRRLIDLMSEIIESPWNQFEGHVHWLSFLGLLPVDPESGEPTWDDAVYTLQSSCREAYPGESS